MAPEMVDSVLRQAYELGAREVGMYATGEGYLSVENTDFENMLIVADLNKVSLKEGWYGDKMKEVRRMFLDDCLEGTLCHGCVHHCQSPSAPLMPEYATENLDIFLDRQVREQIRAAGFPYTKLAYVPMAADILHPGHINILKTAASLGRVVVGLFSNEAIRSYKPEPYMDYQQRKTVPESLKYVDEVVCQTTKDYSDNLRRYRPDYMVHGTDWRKGALEYSGKTIYTNPYSMSREEAIGCILSASGEDPVVSTTGKASREVYELREARDQSHSRDFLTVGSMGHSSSIALGIALQKPDRRVWCLDGDGAALMHLGAMAIIGANRPANLVHIVLNNEALESVGGMPTVAGRADLCAIARACGYPGAVSVDTTEKLDKALAVVKAGHELALIEVKCALGARDDLGRPATTPQQNKAAFMENLEG